MTSRKARATATADFSASLRNDKQKDRHLQQQIRCGDDNQKTKAKALSFSWCGAGIGWRDRIGLREGAAMECAHLDQIRKVRPSAKGCEECLKIGSTWVHLRMCMECGHVGCCDSSPNKHATKHFHKTKHPIMRSIEPGESWGWCYIDEVEVDEAWPS
jgi:hypothetical protein